MTADLQTEQERRPLSTERLNGDDDEDTSRSHLPGCFGCIQRKPWILPAFTGVWLCVSIFTTYAVSESLGHQNTTFPYISHTAIDDPERAIFSQLINIGAVLLGCNAALRYLYIKRIFTHMTNATKWHRTNIVTLGFGIVSAFGLGMVANFPTEPQKPPHYVGAGLAFLLGNIYCWIHTVISWKLRKETPGRRRLEVFIAQLIISASMTVFLGTFGLSKLTYKLQETSGSRHIVSPSLQGLYLTSTITEWLLALSVSFFLFTFIPDSCNFKIKAPEIEYSSVLQINNHVRQEGVELSSKVNIPTNNNE